MARRPKKRKTRAKKGTTGKQVQKHLNESQKDYKRIAAASRLTTGGEFKEGEQKEAMKRARAAQKVAKTERKKRQKAESHQAVNAAKGSYGSKKIAPHAQGRKSSVKLTEVGPEYKDSRGRVSYNPQSIRKAYKKTRSDFNKSVRGLKQDAKETLDVAAMKKEYSRLRAAAVKRLKRLVGAGFGNSQVSKYYAERLPTIAEAAGIKNITTRQIENIMVDLLVDVNRFLASDLSTVKGQTELRNQRILTLREYGYDVDWSNFEYLTDILDYIRDEYQDLFFDSDQLIEEATKYINEVLKDPELMAKIQEDPANRGHEVNPPKAAVVSCFSSPYEP